ncbi:MAG: amidohydrolase family protein [Syntrophomonadaceae bacterium]|nr:amidohydrolase family protein [Syntrophomonadaceae bacterium]
MKTYLVDAHVHIMTDSRNRGGIRWARRLMRDFQAPSGETAEELVDHLRASGVDYFFNLFYPLQPGESRTIHQWHAQLASSYPELVPFASVHPGDADKTGILQEALDELGMAGVKIHPYIQQFDLLDPRMTPVYSYLEQKGYPLLVHTGFARFYGSEPMNSAVDEFLRRYPGLKVVLVHMLWPDRDIDGWPDYLDNYPGLYLDVTNTMVLVRKVPNEENKLRNLAARYSHRMLLGSDFPLGVAYPVARIYERAREVFTDQTSLENLCWRTAVNLAGWHRFPRLVRA